MSWRLITLLTCFLEYELVYCSCDYPVIPTSTMATYSECSKRISLRGTSLTVQWLRLNLPMQEVQVQSLPVPTLQLFEQTLRDGEGQESLERCSP